MTNLGPKKTAVNTESSMLNGNKGDNAASVIVGAISGMAYSGFEDSWVDNAKMFALNKEGGEAEKMIAAIDKLCVVYKKVNP